MNCLDLVQCVPTPLANQLCIAARAFSCFLRILTIEITGCFHHHDIHSVAAWYNWLETWSRSNIAEADCKDQFNNVDPRCVVNYLKESTEWLCSKRRWRAAQMYWSVHKADESIGPHRKGRADFNF